MSLKLNKFFEILSEILFQRNLLQKRGNTEEFFITYKLIMEVYSKISFRNIITKEIEDVNEFTQFTFEFKIKDIKKIPPN